MTDKANEKSPVLNVNEHTDSGEVYKIQPTKVLNLNDTVREVCTRFEYLSKMTNDKRNILDRPGIDWLLNGIKLDDSEITSLALWINGQLKANKISMKPAVIAQSLRIYHDIDNVWQGRNYIGERDGQIFITTKDKNGKVKDDQFISNFTLIPKHTIVVHKGSKFYVYEVKVKGDFKSYELILTTHDFTSLAEIQNRIKEQLSFTSARINRGVNHMEDIAYKYIDLAVWEHEKRGTSLIGLERLENDGPKYFCTPDAIYDLDGNISNDITYMPMNDQQASVEEIKKLTNLKYDKETWYQYIAPNVLKNIVKANERRTMMGISGWMGAIPHDYVVRKEANTGFFPHCHVVGEPGSGKSTIIRELKQLMGHNDASAKAFSTDFETKKSLNSSYTIPTVLDEYMKKWTPQKTDSINATLVEAFTKADWSRGQSNLGSVYFKYKNPLLMAGQIPTSDQALSDRLIVAEMYKTFHKTPEGGQALKHLENLQRMKDKNFWVGYNLWCARHSNEEVLEKYNYYRKMARESVKDSRLGDIYAVVQLGLFYFHKLAMELKISEQELGYTLNDILKLPPFLAEAAGKSVEGEDQTTPLYEFLGTIASFGVRYGNGERTGMLFGKGLAIMPYAPTTDINDPGEYGGRGNKNVACIYGRELILIKVKDMCDVLNQHNPNRKFNERELQTFIDGKFRESISNPNLNSNLVLAPKQYETRYGRYTAFNKDALFELFAEFDNIDWFVGKIKTNKSK